MKNNKIQKKNYETKKNKHLYQKRFKDNNESIYKCFNMKGRKKLQYASLEKLNGLRHE